MLQYISAGMSDAYQPYVLVSAKLYDSNQNLIYSQLFHYGFPENSDNMLHLTADSEYSYQTLRNMVAEVENSAAGLKKGFVKIAEYIGQDLKQSPKEMSAPAIQTGSE